MVGTLKVGTLMIGTMVLALSLGSLPAAAQTGAPAVPDSRALLHALEDAFTSVADRVTPAVVNVSVKPKKGAPGESGQTPESEHTIPSSQAGVQFDRQAPFTQRNPGSQAGAQCFPETVSSMQPVASAGPLVQSKRALGSTRVAPQA